MPISFVDPNKGHKIRAKQEDLRLFSDNELLMLFNDAIHYAPIRAHGVAPGSNDIKHYRPAVIRWGWNEELKAIVSVQLDADAWDNGIAWVITGYIVSPHTWRVKRNKFKMERI